MAALRSCRRLTGQRTARQNLGNIGHADPQLDCDPANPFTVVRRREDTLPKILRIGFATPPKHSVPPVTENRRPTKRTWGAFRNPHFLHGCDSSQVESA